MIAVIAMLFIRVFARVSASVRSMVAISASSLYLVLLLAPPGKVRKLFKYDLLARIGVRLKITWMRFTELCLRFPSSYYVLLYMLLFVSWQVDLYYVIRPSVN